MHLQQGTLLQGGKYKIERFIASGGFGCTYEAYHTLLDMRVALKEFFVSDFCNRDEKTGQVSVATKSKVELIGKLKKKFMDEARALYKMKHPGIVRVIDVFEENGTAYYAMEYIDGQSLSDVVKKRGKLPEAEAVGYIRQVAEALKYVHGLNRLHLDIKPGNIMLNKDGKAVLIDFGASKHYDEDTGENTSTLLGINTKGYAPVEQVNQSFKSFSPATDIYALGATLYKLLSGITPPPSPLLHSEEATLAPLPYSISPSTRQAVDASMKLLRKNRPQTIEEWVKLLPEFVYKGINEGIIDVDDNTIVEIPFKIVNNTNLVEISFFEGSFPLSLTVILKAYNNNCEYEISNYGNLLDNGEIRNFDWNKFVIIFNNTNLTLGDKREDQCEGGSSTTINIKGNDNSVVEAKQYGRDQSGTLHGDVQPIFDYFENIKEFRDVLIRAKEKVSESMNTTVGHSVNDSLFNYIRKSRFFDFLKSKLRIAGTGKK